MGSVRSDHVGQRRAVSAAAATSGAHSASGTASPGPPRHQPAATDSPLVACPAAGWVEGGNLRGGTRGRGGPEPATRPPLHCGARGWGAPRSRPLRGGRWVVTLSGGPPATGGCCVSRKPGPHPSPRGWGEGGSEAWREREDAKGRRGVGDVSVYIFFIQQMPLKWLLPLFP